MEAFEALFSRSILEHFCQMCRRWDSNPHEATLTRF
jgi:hypothetical protein